MRPPASAPPTSPIPEALRRVRLQVFAAAWMSYAGFYVCRKVFGVVRGQLRDALGVTDLSVSYLWTTYLVSYMLGQFVTAMLGRTFRARDILLWGMGVTALSTVVIGTLAGPGTLRYSLLLIAMAVQGLAQASGWASNVAIMTHWTEPRERGRIMALWGTCYQLGSVFAKSFAAFLFGWLGLAWCFWGTGLVMLAVLLLFSLLIHESPEGMGRSLSTRERLAVSPASNVSALDESAPVSRTTGGERRLAQRIIAMGLIYLCFKFLRYALDSWSALFAAEHFQIGTATAGHLSAIFDLLGFIGVLAAGWSSDRLFAGRRSPVIFLMSVGCLLATAALWKLGMASLPAYVVLLGLVGFMVMGPDSLLAGPAAMDVGTNRQAITSAALINGLGSIGPIGGEPIIGWLKVHHGIPAILSLLTAVAVLAAVSTGIFFASMSRRSTL